MNQVNVTIKLNPSRLNLPCATIYARQLHSVVAEVRGIPDDVTSVVLRIFKTDGVSHYDLPVSRRPNGVGLSYAIGTCFPNSGDAHYEVHAYDARDNMTALGCGAILVEEFSGTAAPLTPGQSVPIMQITDNTGALHTIRAVSDGHGNYTTILDDTEAE